ncbi:PEBP-like protein [Lojkania enalia]|uniref:PEBP-like protein n=1 Tax=Lojkania enalia TaxID=147567 RepID=A0A9P4K7H7_9PLEO|nr:PEBP-like protein [Didymosphaeria enalia]
MLGKNLLSVGVTLGLVGSVSTQAAPGFPIQASQTLGVTFGENEVSPPGEQLPRAGMYLPGSSPSEFISCAPCEHLTNRNVDTANPPNVTTPVFTSRGRAVLFMVDSDVPRNGTRVQLLHWLVTNATLGDNGTLNVPSPGEAPYLQPSPPVGDVPHAYTFMLFSQPENFTIPAQFNAVLESRVGFNMSGFVEAAKLYDPLAANYIRVQNVTGTPTTTFPPPRPTNGSTPTGSPTPLPFPGSGVALGLGAGKLLWVGMGTAVVAGVMGFVL